MAEVSKNRLKPFGFLTEILRLGYIVFKYYEKCPYRHMDEVVSISPLILNVTKIQKITIIFLAFLSLINLV